MLKSVLLCLLKRVGTAYVMAESAVVNMYRSADVLVQTVVVLLSFFRFGDPALGVENQSLATVFEASTDISCRQTDFILQIMPA